jgi:aldehyde dehydrogenase (NAD+)
VPVGDPRRAGTLVGPLIDEPAFKRMAAALEAARDAGGVVTGGERVDITQDRSSRRTPGPSSSDADASRAVDGTAGPSDELALLGPGLRRDERSENGIAGGFYVRPALVEMPEQAEIVRQETFAPILYVMRYSALADAIALQNDVPQGLSSSIFTNDLREAELFTSQRGSDCGIANVNIGPSGAEIGGAFGGEKETGGGREAGSDSWKAYMRRATNTVNYGATLPLAQGVSFDI